MSDSLACPECGNIEFEQNNLVKFDLDGDVVDEEQGTYCCNSCGWELSDEDGSPITDSEEIVQKFFLSSKTIVLALSIASSSLCLSAGGGFGGDDR